MERRHILMWLFLLCLCVWVFRIYSYDIINCLDISYISFCRTVLQYQADYTKICIIAYAFLPEDEEGIFVCRLIGLFRSI